MDLRRDLQQALSKIAKPNLTSTDDLQKESLGKKGMWTLPFLPPGFRTGVIWKMIFGSIGYLFIFWIGLSAEFARSDGSAITGFYLWANRMTFLTWSLLTIAFLSDYLGLQKHLPFMQRKYLRWVGYLLWPIIFLFLLVLILTIVGG